MIMTNYNILKCNKITCSTFSFIMWALLAPPIGVISFFFPLSHPPHKMSYTNCISVQKFLYEFLKCERTHDIQSMYLKSPLLHTRYLEKEQFFAHILLLLLLFFIALQQIHLSRLLLGKYEIIMYYIKCFVYNKNLQNIVI